MTRFAFNIHARDGKARTGSIQMMRGEIRTPAFMPVGTAATVKAMKPGSVILDMAVEQGGNCPLSELGKTVIKHGVHIIGEANLPALLAADASALYARNVLDFLKLVVNKEGALHIDMEDDIVAACLMTQGGEVKRK